jgi:EmrB/QacA subfamily drug resistance transporter
MSTGLESARAGEMTRAQRLTIVATGLGMFMVFLDALIVNVALPDIQTEFDVGEAGAQAVVTAYSVGMAVTIMWSATLADLRGRRRVYVASAIVFCGASIMCGIAPDFSLLVIGRAVQGLAAGPITVTSLALLSASFTDTKARTRAIGIWSGIASIGTALGPSIGGILVDGLGWRSIFLVNVPVGVLLVALTLLFVEESSDPADRDFDHLGQLYFGVSIAAFAAALITAPQNGWLSIEVIAMFALAVVCLAAFARRELRTDDPMMDLHLFENGVYRLALITLFVIFFVAYGLLLIVTQYFQNVRDYSAIEAGFLILPLELGIVVFAPMAGRIEGRIGRRTSVLTALTLTTVGVAAIIAGLSTSVAVICIGMGLVGIGLALTLVPLTDVSMSVVPPEKSGMASGIMSTQRAIGSTAGYALLGSILALWVGGHIDDELSAVVPDASQREEISSQIIDQANPSAFVAAIGPGQPLKLRDLAVSEEVIDVADDVFVTGMRISLLLALAASALTLLAVVMKFPRTQPVED